MKRIAFLLLLAVSFPSYGKGIINFRISKPVCLLTFLQAANSDADVPSVLSAYINKGIHHHDSARFSKIVKKFSGINLHYGYFFPEYPVNRQWQRTTDNLIFIAAVQAVDVSDFLQRIIGILSNEQWLKLKSVLTEAEPYYHKLIELPYDNAINRQLTELKKFNGASDDIFRKLTNFYGSTWSNDIPFTVSIYPVPGNKNNTTATPHNNSIVLAVMTEEKNHAMSVSVAIHEMCHVLYEEQALSVQTKIDNAFSQNKSSYTQYAYSFFDEALATASANGWAYRQLSGDMLDKNWYSDEYINGYAHAIYPMVSKYINEGRQIDKAFVNNSILLFEKKFPKAIYNYRNLLNKVTIYTDAIDHEQFASVIFSVKNHFQIYKSNSTYPISDPQSISMIDDDARTQLFIIHSNHAEDFKILKSKFPQLKKLSPEHEGIISFFDNKKRPIIIINVMDIRKLDKALDVMAKAKEMNPDKIFTAVD